MTGAGLALLLSSAAHAQAIDPVAAKFAAREGVANVSISPDGKKIAVVAPRPQGGEGILVVPLDGGRPVAMTGSEGNGDEVHYCDFATDTRLICMATFRQKEGKYLNVYSRVLAVNSDGSGMKMLTPNTQMNAYYEVNFGGAVVDLVSPDGGNSILLSKYNAEEFTTGSIVKRNKPGLGVISIDTVSGKSRELEPPRQTASEYISDGTGQVRVMGTTKYDQNGYLAGRDSYSFRAAGSREWQPMNTVEYDAQTATGFVPQAVDSKLDVVYGFGARGGLQALFSRKLVPGAEPQLVLGRNDVDVDSLLTIGRQRRVVGASYAAEKRMVEFFDPELKKLSISLAKAFPASSQISYVDASADENKLVLFVSSDVNPGVFYVYDKGTRQLSEILPVRPELAGMKLAEVRPVTYPAADGTMIPGYLTLPPGSDGKNLPAIVMPHGGPSARDEWGFDWLSQYFAAKGFAVLQPNYRGSAGYGSAWFQKNGFRSWRTAIGDVNDAGRWLTSQGIAAPGKLAIVGWSYGGYAALQSPVLDPDLYKAIVAIAPVTDLDKWRSEKENTSSGKLVNSFIGTGPHIEEGSPARHADAFKVPVLMFHGEVDQNVAADESRLMVQRLKAAGKQVDYVEFKGLDHYIEDPASRGRMLTQTAAFLKTTLGL